MLTRDEFIAYIEAQDPHTIHKTLGIRIEQYDADETVAAIDVDERLFQHAGIVHGGLYVLLAESAASIAAALSVDITQNIIAGMEINANHLRSTTSGTLRARTKPVYKGRSTMVYHIELTDNDGRMVCISRCTLAVRPRA